MYILYTLILINIIEKFPFIWNRVCYILRNLCISIWHVAVGFGYLEIYFNNYFSKYKEVRAHYTFATKMSENKPHPPTKTWHISCKSTRHKLVKVLLIVINRF